MAGKFVLKKGPTGKFRFNLLSSNGNGRHERGLRDEACGPGGDRVGANARCGREARRHHREVAPAGAARLGVLSVGAGRFVRRVVRQSDIGS